MNDESQRMIQILRTVMHLLGLRPAQVERALGWSVSSVSRILTGRVELRFEHVVDIGRAMGLEPQEVLRFAYPDWGEPPSEAGRRVRETLGFLAPSKPPAPLAPQPEARLAETDVERMVARAMRRMFSEKLEE